MKRPSSIPYFHLIRTCWHYAGTRRWQMVVFCLMSLAANIANSAQPYVVGRLINRLQQGGGDLMHEALFWLSISAGIMVVFWALHGPARVIERNLSFHVRNAFLQHYYSLITWLPMHWHHEHHTGNTVNRINKAAAGLYGFSDEQYIYIQNLVTTVVAFGMLAYIAHSVALIEVTFAVLIIALLLRFNRIIIPLLHARNEREHSYTSLFFDCVSNINSVISFNLTDYTRRKLNRLQAEIAGPLQREVIYNELKWCSMMLLIAAAEFTVMVFYIHAILTTGNTLMLGSLVAIYQYMHSLNQLFFSFASNYSRLQQQKTDLMAAAPLEEAFAELSTRDEGKPALQVTRGAIAFDHVSFSYPKENRVFNDLSLVIPATQKVGVVGRSGAGKTTLINLLLHFFETNGDDIRIDGQNISAVTHESLRRNIAVIPQDTSLFETTLMENIRCGRTSATDEEVIAAATKAHAHEFISQLPEGYNALVGERGIKLSGGQRQRVAIARAILKDAPILILDEATSAPDSESEKYIQESFAKLMADKTVIAIAHRLSTISTLDRLVVMDKGRIVEDGTHTELLAKGGYYAKLWAMQSGGFLPD